MEIRLGFGLILAAIGLVTAAGLLGFGVWFDRRVTHWHEHEDGIDEGYVALEVAAGTLATITLLTPFWLVLLSGASGPLCALWIWLSLLFGFACSGIPMIHGDLTRHLRRRRNTRKMNQP